MKIIAIIPARMASTRFPGKPLADICGLPMIEHVRRRVLLSPSVKEAVVATCDNEIYDVVTNNGGKAVMTSSSHERCTDRVAEASKEVKSDIVINVQGDEPMVNPVMLELLIKPLIINEKLYCSNLMTEIEDDLEFVSPDTVKTVFDTRYNALYFSREPIPSLKKWTGQAVKRYKQLGIIAFRTDFLNRFASLPQTPLEIAESVDMMRAIEHGYKVRMVLSPFNVYGVDTHADLKYVVGLMQNDQLLNSYIGK